MTFAVVGACIGNFGVRRAGVALAVGIVNLSELADDRALPEARDFLAGMTDRYAVRLFEQLYIPKPWAID